jgi:hypothetical protein
MKITRILKYYNLTIEITHVTTLNIIILIVSKLL